MYLVSGAKHFPSSSTGQVVLRIKIPDFSEIWVKWISNASRKIFEWRRRGKFLNHFGEALGALDYRIGLAGRK